MNCFTSTDDYSSPTLAGDDLPSAILLPFDSPMPDQIRPHLPLKAEGYPSIGCECCEGTVWVPFKMIRQQIHAKAAKVFLDGLCRCVLRRGALRRAVLENGTSSCLDALPQLGGLLRCQCVGPTIPDPL